MQKHLPLSPDDRDSTIILRKPILTNSSPSLLTNYKSPSHPDKDRNRFQIDISLATEIGQNLLSKIRGMQQTIQQQEQTLAALRLEKMDIQCNLDALKDRLRTKCEVEERLNAEIWNLELGRQEQMEQTQVLNQALARAHMDQARIIRQHALINQELELLKAVQDSWMRDDTDQNTQLNDVLRRIQKDKEDSIRFHRPESECPYPRRICKSTSKEQIVQHPTIEEMAEEDDDSSSYASTASDSDPKQSSNDRGHCIIEQQRPKTWTCTQLPAMSNLPEVDCRRNSGIIPRPTSLALETTFSVGSSLPEHPMIDEARSKHTSVLSTGNWMWKFTRTKALTTERRHLRFVWFEPSTKTVYWKRRDKSDPPKSALIKSFIVEMAKDDKRIPALVLKTEDREIKIQCMNFEAHNSWVQALEYILGLESLRCLHHRRSRFFGSNSPGTRTTRRQTSGVFRNVPTMPSLKSLSSFYRKGGDYRDSGVASFDDQQQDMGHIRSIFTSGFSSSNSSSDPDLSISNRLSRKFSLSISKQQLFSTPPPSQRQPYDAKFEC
ncbi:hypothetical protein BJV82DRAFT_652541 [Fennellomyces sp. T-0311]|nr:hypothetical protein BJV82DRAFT_652541 [Fennellomyces sp. T-0311]